MKTRILPMFALLLALIACKKEEPAPALPSLIVEGWIESGGHPVVQLSESFPVQEGNAITMENIIGRIAKWAKVTVSDGENEVILTGKTDIRYFPPYVYTTDKMTGEAGRSYTLRVDYKDYHATGTTTIPEPVPIDTLYVKEAADSLCTVICGFTDPPGKGNYYKIFTKTTDIDSHYIPSVLAAASDENVDGYTEIPLFSSLRSDEAVFFPNLRVGEELWVKLCTVGKDGFDFWNSYEMMLAGNMGIANSKRYSSGNMLLGASGYWIGYGVAEEKSLNLTEPEK